MQNIYRFKILIFQESAKLDCDLQEWNSFFLEWDSLVAFCAFLKAQGESMAAYVCLCDLLQKQLLTVAGKALICYFENLCMFYKKDI